MVTYSDIFDNNNLIEDVRLLYEGAFPIDERRDFADVLQLLSIDKANFRMIVATDEGRFIGFISYWTFRDFVYVEHFAVKPDERGGGVGTSFLKHFLQMQELPVVLEVELPVDEMSARRVAFYERMGFKLWQDFYYFQPPYDENREGMELKIMSRGDVDLTELATFVGEIKNKVYGCGV